MSRSPADGRDDAHRQGMVLGVWLGAGGLLALFGLVVALGAVLGLASRAFRWAMGA